MRTEYLLRDFFFLRYLENRGFPGGSVAKNPPAMQERWVRSLGQEDPLEQEMANHSNILAWEIPWTEEPGELQSMDHKESDTTANEHACTLKIHGSGF